RSDILTCVLRPGDAISEATLVGRYGVGKAPVRAALSRLRQEGLVSASPRRSYVVAPITLRDVQELYALRLILEPATARLAAGKVDARRLEKLDAICRKGYTPGDPASTLRFLAANREFHLQVAESGGNQRFVRLLAQILDETTRVMHIGLALRNRNAEMQHEHHALLDALQRNDGEAAARIAEQQVAASRDMVLSGLLGSDALLDQPLA
ncbi:MAG: GntR family transcriptional regulator, partial [Burkholderiaceae bacterium]|nr:GntR family transcriptional regulator [Burkholderiaceae bacterium]